MYMCYRFERTDYKLTTLTLVTNLNSVYCSLLNNLELYRETVERQFLTNIAKYLQTVY